MILKDLKENYWKEWTRKSRGNYPHLLSSHQEFHWSHLFHQDSHYYLSSLLYHNFHQHFLQHLLWRLFGLGSSCFCFVLPSDCWTVRYWNIVLKIFIENYKYKKDIETKSVKCSRIAGIHVISFGKIMIIHNF